MTETIAVLGVGASRGLGTGIARRFAKGGFRVFVAGRKAERLVRVAGEVTALGGGVASAIACDVTDRGQVVDFFDAVEAAAGVPEVVCYNAGNNQFIPFLELTPEQFDDFWRVCCFGGFLVGQEAARRMLPRGSGSILFTGASASRRGRAGFAHFAAGKAGLKVVAESMAREFGPQGLHVAHVVIDGAIDGERIHTRRPDLAKARGADGLLAIDDIAEAFWQLHHQGPTAWTFETELRPYKEPF
jgi:NAD(P)-dependent dehydrogenase (short-subunit alcohol dehydrogenase family)